MDYFEVDVQIFTIRYKTVDNIVHEDLKKYITLSYERSGLRVNFVQKLTRPGVVYFTGDPNWKGRSSRNIYVFIENNTNLVQTETKYNKRFVMGGGLKFLNNIYENYDIKNEALKTSHQNSTNIVDLDRADFVKEVRKLRPMFILDEFYHSVIATNRLTSTDQIVDLISRILSGELSVIGEKPIPIDNVLAPFARAIKLLNSLTDTVTN